MAKPSFLGSDAKAYLDTSGTKVVSEVAIEGTDIDLTGELTVPTVNGTTVNGTTGSFSTSVSSPTGSFSTSVTAGTFNGSGSGLTNIPLSVTTNSASGNGSLSYNAPNGTLTFTPANLSSVDASITIGSEGSPSGNGAISWNSGSRTLTYTPPTAAGLGISEYTPPTAAGAVGTYAFLVAINQAIVNPGSTLSGGSLKYGVVSLETSLTSPEVAYYTNRTGIYSTALTGVWRCMGYSLFGTTGGRDPNNLHPATLWLRIS